MAASNFWASPAADKVGGAGWSGEIGRWLWTRQGGPPENRSVLHPPLTFSATLDEPGTSWDELGRGENVVQTGGQRPGTKVIEILLR